MSRTLWRVAAVAMVTAWALLLFAWLALHWFILPQVNDWRPQIEQRASQALGIPVRIGQIRVRSAGWMPALELDDVVLLDHAQRVALRLPRVTAAVSARSMFALELRLEQLLIEDAQIDARRDAQGRLHIAGLDMSDTADADHSAADWFLSQPEFVLRNGRLRWTDERREAAVPLELVAVDLVVRNGLRHHDIRLDATPPAAWGERFSLRGRFTQPLLARSSDWRRWRGELHADLPHANVAELRRHVKLPFDLSEGEGALRAWGEMADGELEDVTADLALRAVALRLAPTLEPLAVEQVEGRLHWQRETQGFSVQALGLGFITRDGVRWPRGDLKLTLRQPAKLRAQGASGGEFSAQHLDLQVMSQMASRIPLSASARTLLTQLAPQGLVQDLALRWQGPIEAPERYRVKVKVQRLGVTATPAPDPGGIGRPGLRNAWIELHADETGGQAALKLDAGALAFPGVFEQPEVGLDQFAADLSWRIEPARTPGQPPQVEIQVKRARFANADAQGDLNAQWRTGNGPEFGRGGRFPGVLNLSGNLQRGRAQAVARYLPLGLPESVRHYVEQAVRDGQIGATSFKVRGDLGAFPFRDPRDGEFHIAGPVRNVDLAYVPAEPGAPPAWPPFREAAADLVFDRTAMAIRNAKAKVYGVELQRVNGAIPDLGSERPLLNIDGQARGPLADLLRYTHSAPIGDWLGGGLREASALGVADLRLALSIPLNEPEQSTAKGSLALAGNDVRLRPDLPLLGAAKARIDFTHKGVSLAGSAHILGGDASFDGGTRPDGTLRFSGQGMASADGLRRAGELGWVARLGGVLSGQAAYRLTLGVVRGQSELTLTSNLAGLAINLPAPLRKTADTVLPLRVQTSLLASAGSTPDGLPGSAQQDLLRLELGQLVQAQYVRDVSQTTPRVLRGGIGVFAPVPSPAIGVQAQLNLASVDADAWQDAAARLADPTASALSPAGHDNDYLPQSLALQAQELVAGARRLTRVVAGLSYAPADSSWRIVMDAEQMGGYAEYRQARGSASPGRIYARLTRLKLPPSEAESVDSLLDQAALTVPALDIVVDDFELRGRKLGRVEIEAVNRAADDGAREWQLNRFNIDTPEAKLAATGQLRRAAPGARRRMVMDFRLDLADSGAFLNRLGIEHALRGGKGTLQGQLSWAGSPLTLHLPSMHGQMNLALDAGQFLKAGPGAARLLSLLSLQALPRRLMLDFRDLFQEGFTFDNVTGDVAILDGVASTNNLRMRGLQAAVLMAGSADLERETADLRVVVVPEINAGTASLAFAAINPAVGLGSFLAQLILRRPLVAAGTREFHVSGPWAEPKVDAIERKLGESAGSEPVSKPAAASPAPSSPAKGARTP